jgi:hypothetical protein
VQAPPVEFEDGVVEIDVRPLLRTLDVRVVDGADGTPIAGASVECSNDFGEDVDSCGVSGPDGTARIDASVENCVLRLTAAGRLPARLDAAAGEDRVTVRMTRGTDVTVRVRAAASGATVAGAPVWWTRLGSFARGGPAVTDASGVAHLGPLGSGSTLIFVAGAEWVSEGLEPESQGRRSTFDGFGGAMQELGSSASVRPRLGIFEIPAAGSAVLEVRAEPARHVAGRVLERPGVAAAGALVSAACPEWFPWPQLWRDGPWARTATADDGTYALRGVWPRAGQEIRAAAPGFVGLTRALPPEGQRAEFQLFESASPTVVVREGGTGAPIAGARVSAYEQERSERSRHVHRDVWDWRTRRDGSARVGPLVVAATEIRVEAEGYLERDAVPVASDRLRSPEPIVVELERGLDVSGRVLLPDGTPARKGHVFVAAPDATSKYGIPIGPDGRFVQRGLTPGTYEIEAHVEDGDLRFSAVTVTETGGPLVELRLAADDELPQEVHVRVVDPAGEPVASACYRLSAASFGTASRFDGGRVPLGQFGQMDGVTLEVFDVRDASGTPCGVGPTRVRLPNPLPPDFVVRLEPDRPVAGTVRDGEGRPVAGARVQAFAEDASERFGRAEALGSAVAGEDGSFEIRGLGASRHRLAAEVPPELLAPDGVVVDGGATDVRIVATAAERPRVLVLGPDGRPCGGARVVVEAYPFDAVASASTAADGWAVLPALRATAELRLSVDAGPDVLGHSSPWKPAPETTVRLRRSLTIEGTIVGPDGAPLPRAVYWVIRPERAGFLGGGSQALADADGRFVIRELDGDGEALVAVGDFAWRQWSMPGWPSLEDEDAVARIATRVPPGTKDARVAPTAGTTLAVRLPADADGRGRDDEFLLVSKDRQQSHVPVRLREPGALLFTGLKTGDAYTLVVRLPSRGRVAFREGLVPGADPVEVPLTEGNELVGKIALPGDAPVRDVDVRAEFGSLCVRTKASRDGTFRIPCLPPVRLDVRVFASERDGNWCGDFTATPGGDPPTLRPGELPIPATPR